MTGYLQQHADSQKAAAAKPLSGLQGAASGVASNLQRVFSQPPPNPFSSRSAASSQVSPPFPVLCFSPALSHPLYLRAAVVLCLAGLRLLQPRSPLLQCIGGKAAATQIVWKVYTSGYSTAVENQLWVVRGSRLCPLKSLINHEPPYTSGTSIKCPASGNCIGISGPGACTSC